MLHTALRETKEEVGIDASRVEVLGRLGPPTKSWSGLRVWPYVAFLHETPESVLNEDDTSVLASPSLSSLTLSRNEVATTFHLPLRRLSDSRYHREHRFRGSFPYWACDVTDLVAPGTEWSNAGASSPDKVGRGIDGRLEIWGLTGWYLNMFLRVLSGPLH